MEQISISELRSNFGVVLERLEKTRRPICVTRYGKPFAEIAPVRSRRRKKSWLGFMAGTAEILGDIVGPSTDESDWDIFKPTGWWDRL